MLLETEKKGSYSLDSVQQVNSQFCSQYAKSRKMPNEPCEPKDMGFRGTMQGMGMGIDCCIISVLLLLLLYLDVVYKALSK